MIVGKMLNIFETARSIYEKEALSYIRVSVSDDNYVEVESMGIDSEFLDTWGGFVKIEPSERESAIRLIKRINFGNERVEYLENGVELYIRRSPRIEKIEESIDALRRADFYSELHQEESCVYSCILKDTKKAQKELREFLGKYKNVECHLEDGIYELYM